MPAAPIILVPGFWLGAWAWDEVVGLLRGHLAGAELPLPLAEDLAENENLDGLTDEQLAEFRRRAVPEPAGVLRDAPELTNEARLDVPSTVICTGFSSDQVRAAVREGYPWLSGLTEVRNVTYVDLPTSHWPMWSRPRELAAILADVASHATGR
jgi:pimeloyl-ACP methyl ester carboxylesterase